MTTVHRHRSLSAITAAVLSLTLVFMVPLSALASFNGILPLTRSGSMPTPLAGPTITMSSNTLTEGQTATVTITFPAAPLDFTASDTSATNGILSNLASTTNPNVYTETFTPSINTNAPTNTISVTGKVIGTTYKDPSFNEPYGIAFDGTNMWITNANSGDIDKITPSGTVTAYSGFDGPSGIAFDGTNMWVTNYGGPGGSGSGNGHTVYKVSPSGTIIASTTVTQAPTAIAFDGTNMWVASYVDGTAPGVVTEIASTSAILRTATTSPGPNGIAFDGTNMWTANYGSFTYAGQNFTDFEFDNNGNSVSKVTPSGAITTYSGTGDEPSAIAFDGANMWVTNENNNGILGGDSVTKITGTISPSTSANYVVNTIPPSTGDSGSSGGSITSQIQNLIQMGNTQEAQQLQNEWPTLVVPRIGSTNASTTITTTSTTPSASTTPTSSTSTFTRWLKLGMSGLDVMDLQQYLNAHGFLLATTGSGSSGHETDYFGTLTFNALVKFQEANAAQILTPKHLVSGTGLLGPSTISFITSH